MAAQKDPIEIDPIQLQEDVGDRMRRYLLTSLPIHRRFPRLRETASAELEKSASLIRGPYLEALPDFPKQKTLLELVESGILDPGFKNLNDEVLRRSLHEHQAEAISRVVSQKQNVVVATGTGSGKTECFLFPLIDSLLKANVAGKPGIRAILVYPLNALANDQLYRRIVPFIAKDLKDYGITVGRYTGQTKPNKGRAFFEEQYLQDPFFKELFGPSIPENWLLSRDEMLDTPPHILVTNYAMLEHLLLLPRNAPLFQNADLQLLVLDEVHTYAGAQATEVAMLLRKLRNRHAPKADLRCIGTSASLGTTDEAKTKVMEFAGKLFGFPFQKVITATRKAHHLLQKEDVGTSISPSDWIELHSSLRKVRHLENEMQRRDQWNDLVMEANIDLLVENQETTLSALLCSSLSKDRSVREVSRILSEEGLQSLSNIAARIFPDATSSDQAQEALTGLVALGAFARESEKTFPLLPARYHLFTRGIDEATIELVHPEENGEQGCNLRFRREFLNSETGGPRYRLLTCRKCGELYFEAFEKAQRITPERSGKGWRRAVFWLKPKESHVIPSDSTEEEATERATPEQAFIHLTSGVVKDQLEETDTPKSWIFTHRARMDKPTPEESDRNPDASARVTMCLSCGAHERNEIITPFHPGDQALSATICEVLYSHLPTSKKIDDRGRMPGRGRNLLVFSDNRQDAAFFAPYFQRTHEDLLVRRAILKRLKSEGPGRLTGMAEDLCHPNYLLKGGLTNQDGRKAESMELAQIVRGKIFSEFCSPGGSRVSLEDLGLVLVEYDMLDLEELARLAKVPTSLGGNLIRWVLDTIRLNRAISMPSELRAEDEFVWGSYAQDDRRYALEITDSQSRFRILPSRRNDGSVFLNRYVDVLRDKLKISDWEVLLRQIWTCLIDDSDGAVLRSDPEGSPLRVLDHRYLKARLRGESEPIFRCNRCSRISTYLLGEVCTQWRCDGRIELVPSDEWTKETQRNHYHHLYGTLEDLPSVMAREHTAAIATELREEIENSFKAGNINLLSSSTTMEMGIDLGDLEGVFLRNVPPDISNYQQRAGRAGRRAQAAPVSITYSRNRRYDQDVYQHADEFLAKEPRTPFVHLGNARLFQRHQFSVLIGSYMSDLGLNETGIQIGQIFGLSKFKLDGGALVPESGGHPLFSEEDQEIFVSKITAWLAGPSADEAKRLAGELLNSLLPSISELEAVTLRNTHGALENAFLTAMGKLVGSFGDRFRHYTEKAEELNLAGRAGVDSMRNRAYRWANQRVLNFLSKYGVIPTYSFPVDSIDLEVLQGKWSNRSDIELSRDARLGIVEYAPGAEIIANGRVWTSRAISQHPREFMPPFHYKICETCRHIEAWEDRSLIPAKCSSCDAVLKSAARTFIEPKGFTTAVGESTGKEPGSSRALPPSAMETQLIGNAPDHHFRGSDLLRVDWALQNAQEGRMVVINRGSGDGFVKCGCGYAHAVTRSRQQIVPHNNPLTDHVCEQKPSSWRFDLAHTFHTDVLQMRCRVRVPVPNLPGSNPEFSEQRQAMEGVARSVCEAIRLACCELLQIPEMEISSTFRWLPNDALELIFFDNVPGGAGYTSKVFELKAVSDLLRFARELILECPGQCSTSCSKCLRSYSNQTHWESFRRRDAMAWLDNVLLLKRSDPRTELGATEIQPALLRDHAESASRIVIIRDRLGDFSGGMEADDQGKELPLTASLAEWGRINQLLAAGKKITLICRQFPKFDDTSLPRARRFAEVLLPHVRSGLLKLALAANHAEPLADCPDTVFFDDSAAIATLVYDLDKPAAVFQQLWSDNLLARDASLAEGETFVRHAGVIEPSALERPESIRRFYYRSGEVRQLERDFAFVKTGRIHRLEIIDRYMVAADSNSESLGAFLNQLSILWSAPPKEIVLKHGPSPQQQNRSQWIGAMDKVIKSLKGNPLFAGTEFKNEFRGQTRERNFHDRRVVIEYSESEMSPADNGAPSARRRPRQQSAQLSRNRMVAELTGGVDVLMDPREETTIYVYQPA